LSDGPGKYILRPERHATIFELSDFIYGNNCPNTDEDTQIIGFITVCRTENIMEGGSQIREAGSQSVGPG
jgi:hypothetical protein